MKCTAENVFWPTVLYGIQYTGSMVFFAMFDTASNVYGPIQWRLSKQGFTCTSGVRKFRVAAISLSIGKNWYIHSLCRYRYFVWKEFGTNVLCRPSYEFQFIFFWSTFFDSKSPNSNITKQVVAKVAQKCIDFVFLNPLSFLYTITEIVHDGEKSRILRKS